MSELLTDEELASIEVELREYDGRRPPGLPRALMETVELLLAEVRSLRAENAAMRKELFRLTGLSYSGGKWPHKGEEKG